MIFLAFIFAFTIFICIFVAKIHKNIDNMWTELSDTAILNKLGTRLKASRISSGLKQQELAAESGVGVSTIAKIENGQSVSLSLLISVMRTLGLLENLDLLVPEQKPSPMELLKMQGKQVKRVRTKKD
jgi:DNA-binding XRE family transcriptional regulator